LDISPQFTVFILVNKETTMKNIMKITSWMLIIAAVIFVTTLSATASSSMTTADQKMATPSQSIWFQQGNMPATYDLSSGICNISSGPSNSSVWFRNDQMQPKNAFPPAGAICKLTPGESTSSIWFKG
jgi:hypothetical protein